MPNSPNAHEAGTQLITVLMVPTTVPVPEVHIPETIPIFAMPRGRPVPIAVVGVAVLRIKCTGEITRMP
jgi:hypothetical protein